MVLAIAVEGPALAPAAFGAVLHHGVALTPALIAGLLFASVCGYAFLVRFGERRAPSELALKAAPLQFVCGILFGAALMGLIYVLLLGAGLYRLRAGHMPDWPLQALYAFATALLEELLFRAVVLRLLTRVCGVLAGLALSALLFGAAHLLSPHATLTGATAIAVEAGLLLGACFLLTGRLWLAVGLHAGWNFTEGPVLGAVVSGHVRPDTLFVSGPAPDASPLWSGGAFGPEASPIAMVVGLIAFATLATLSVRRTFSEPEQTRGMAIATSGGEPPS